MQFTTVQIFGCVVSLLRTRTVSRLSTSLQTRQTHRQYTVGSMGCAERTEAQFGIEESLPTTTLDWSSGGVHGVLSDNLVTEAGPSMTTSSSIESSTSAEDCSLTSNPPSSKALHPYNAPACSPKRLMIRSDTLQYSVNPALEGEMTANTSLISCSDSTPKQIKHVNLSMGTFTNE